MKDLGIKKDINKKIQYLWYKYCWQSKKSYLFLIIISNLKYLNYIEGRNHRVVTVSYL